MKKKSFALYLLELWIGICERRKRSYFSHQMEKELCNLNPGVQREKIVREYCLEKIKIGLLILGISGIVVLLSVYNAAWNGDLERERYIERSKEGRNKTIILDAKIGEELIKDVVIEVEERELSDNEKKVHLEEVKELLKEEILGENDSLEQIRYPLNLMNTWEDGSIILFWTSSNYKVLKEDGSLGTEEIPKEGVSVIVTAVLEYEGMQIKEQIPVRVYPKEQTREEKIKERLSVLIEENKEKTKMNTYLELPQFIDQKEIVWKESSTGKIATMAGLWLLVFLGVLWGKDRNIHKKYEERNKQLLLEYSEFVSKLQILICSGMSVRNSFIRLGKDYERRKEQGGKQKYVYEELLVVIRKMESGMSEAEAYDCFAKRCDLICYKKLMSIILQNVRKGTEGLKESLLTETKNAFEERKQSARRMGEEAGTKLLFPMMIMMGIVLMIIVIPAYFSFGGI